MSRITPPVPNTTLTPAYSSVSSASGFQSGDLVYFRDSNFGPIPNNAVSSANFPITANVSRNQTAFNATVNWAEYDPNNQTGSTNSRAPSVALLTNGNIVVVFAEHPLSGGGTACFKIIDQNGVIVVDRTSLGFTSSGVIGVCALTGGGFAIAVSNFAASSAIWHGVYSNTGAVVTAMAVDTSFGTSRETLEIRALSGGGYVIATFVGGGTYGFRTYSNVGVAGSYNTNSGWNNLSQIVITTFSDNTFAALYPSGSSNLQVTRFNNTGAVVGTTSVTSDWNPSTGFDFITLSTGAGVILNIDADSGSNWQWARTYTQSSGSISGRTRIAGNQGFQQTVNGFALSAGGFVATNAIPSSGNMQLIRYNASFGSIGAVSLDGFPAYFPGVVSGYGQRTTIIEGSAFLTLVDNSYATTSHTFHAMPYIQIDKANLTIAGIRRRFQSPQVVGNLPAAVSGYARSASTPNAASFFASTSQTLTRNIPASTGTTFALTPFTAITDVNVVSHCLTVMTNGQFVIAYRSGTTGSSSGNVFFSVFNADGTLFTTVSVVSNAARNLIRCTCLGNGKLVVSWVPAADNSVNFSVFAAGTYTLLTTGTTLGSISPAISGSPSSWSGSAGHDIAPFGNDSFVLGYANSNGGVTAAVFNDSAAFIVSSSGNNWGGVQCVRIASDAAGDVAIKFFSSSQGQYFLESFARNTTTNSIYNYTVVTLNGNTSNFGEGMAMAPCGSVLSIVNTGGTRQIVKSVTSNTTNNQSLASTSFNAASACAGQFGEFIFISIDSGGAGGGSFFRYATNGSNGPYSTSVAQSVIDGLNFTVTNPNTNNNVGSQAQVINLYDNIYAFSYINGGGSSTGGQVVVGFICSASTSYSTAIVAGVTSSNAALVPSPANGYYLAGVSASECAAGGTGVLQVNGAATLNSQYPAGTPSQAFDFNTPALDVGVRGTIAGRNMIISGGK